MAPIGAPLSYSAESTRTVEMGRGAYDKAHGNFTGYEDEMAIFVLTHNPTEAWPEGPGPIEAVLLLGSMLTICT